MKQLTNKELKKLTKVLNQIEAKEYRAFKQISGGFAIAEMFDYDKDIIDVELKFGVISDCESKVYSEQLKINRKTFKLIN